MSSNFGDEASGAGPTYAVVDISKKKKKKLNTASSGIDLYSKLNRSDPASDNSRNVETYSKVDVVEYSQLACNDKNEKEQHAVFVTDGVNKPQECFRKSSTTPRRDNFKGLKTANCKSICRVVAAVAVLSIILACAIITAISIAMITSLKLDITLLQNQSAKMYSLWSSKDRACRRNMEHMNDSLRNASMRFESDFDALYMRVFGNFSEIVHSNNISEYSLLHNITELSSKLNMNYNSLHKEINLIANATFGHSIHTPAPSCQVIHSFQPSAPSGYYWITSSNGSGVQAYCEMTAKCGDAEGLQRVALLNNETKDEVCVGELKLINGDCKLKNETPGCSHTLFPVMNISYSNVCGTIEVTEEGSPDGFQVHLNMEDGKYYRPSSATLNDNYVDGISLTYGETTNRYHLWTIAVDVFRCGRSVPGFVSASYSCPPRINSGSSSSSGLMAFSKKLPQDTSGDIEMRLCRDQSRGDEDIAIESVEIYVW